MNKLQALYHKYEELILYIVFGVCTTLVYYVARFSMRALGCTPDIAVVIAQVVAITFSFIVSKLFVFKSKTTHAKDFIKEIFEFYAARGLSFLVDLGITHFCVENNSSFFIALLHLDKLPYDSAFFQIGVISGCMGNSVKANEFFFTTLAQIIILVANYLFSKFVVFKKKSSEKAS